MLRLLPNTWDQTRSNASVYLPTERNFWVGGCVGVGGGQRVGGDTLCFRRLETDGSADAPPV